MCLCLHTLEGDSDFQQTETTKLNDSLRTLRRVNTRLNAEFTIANQELAIACTWFSKSCTRSLTWQVEVGAWLYNRFWSANRLPRLAYFLDHSTSPPPPFSPSFPPLCDAQSYLRPFFNLHLNAGLARGSICATWWDFAVANQSNAFIYIFLSFCLSISWLGSSRGSPMWNNFSA